MFDRAASGRLEGLRESLVADLDEQELLGRLGVPIDLAPLTAALSEVAHSDISGLGDADLLHTATGVERARRLLDAASVRLLGELDDRDATDARVGLPTGAWLADSVRLSSAAARAKVLFARELRPLPDVIDALSDGAIGEQHARVLATAAANQRISEQFVALVPELIDDATDLRFDVWRSKVSTLIAALDQDGPEPDDDPAEADVLSMKRGLGGRWLLRGDLDAVTGAAVHQALSTEADKLFHASNRDETVAADLIAPSHPNRMARALVEMCRRNLAAHSNRATAAEIIVHIDAADPSQLLDNAGFPIGDTDRRTLTCDPLLRGVVFGLHRRVLDVGRIKRLVTDAQRVAMTQRDGGCVFPGCDAPASWTDAHHVVHWENDGPTDLTNLASLCRHHHGVSHRKRWRMGVTDDEWFWWVTPNGHFLWSQRHGIQRTGPPPPLLT